MIEIKESATYTKWFKAIKDNITKGCIQDRLMRIREGNFGDRKSVGGGVYELRFRIGGGIRIYYAFDGNSIVLLLSGGNKSSHRKGIDTAKRILNEAGGKE